MAAKKGGKAKSLKKKVVSPKKKKFDLKFNFNSDTTSEGPSIASDIKEGLKPIEATTPKEVKVAEVETKKEVKKQPEKKQESLIQPISAVPQQEVKANITQIPALGKKKSDPVIILIFLIFLLGVGVILASFYFREYFIIYLATGSLFLVFDFIFFIIHKRSMPKVENKQTISQSIAPKIVVPKSDKEIVVSKTTTPEVKAVDPKKEKAKMINLIVVVLSLAIIIFFAVSKGFFSSIKIPSVSGGGTLTYVVYITVGFAAILFLLNALRRKGKRKTTLINAQSAISSGKASPIVSAVATNTAKIIIENKEIKLKKYQTEMDLLLEVVNERKSISMMELSKMFSVSKDLVEEWGKILEEHSLIKIYYPALGEPLFRATSFVEIKKTKVVKKVDGGK